MNKNMYRVEIWYKNDPAKPGASCFLHTNLVLAVAVNRPTKHNAERKAKAYLKTKAFAQRFPWVDPLEVTTVGPIDFLGLVVD